MEPPSIPRSRLVRDYTTEDDHSDNQPSYPRSPDFQRRLNTIPSPSLSNGHSALPQRTYSLKKPDDTSHTSYRESGTRSPLIESYVVTPDHGIPSPRFAVRNDIFWGDNDSESGHNPEQDQKDLQKLDFALESVDERPNLQHRKPTLETVDERSSTRHSNYAPSLSSSSQMTSHTTISGSLGNKMPDFFSHEVFQTVLHNPTTAHQLRLFSETRLCGENMTFLESVEKHRAMLNDVAKIMFEIHRDFISPKAMTQINISDNLLLKANKDLKTSLSSTLPKLESVFVDAQNEIERLVSFDIYPRFVRHQMTKSAAKALSGDRSKYAGLGDCFVLTDPSKADQPIVFASDGFVKVTGYPRNEIIPRNCRFLQCRQTDKSSVKRLRSAIDKRQESVEILLNQTKDGKPFWNLLYTTPLFDAHGNVVFFLGGQVNCSTTIHSQSDILRVLALPDDVDEDKEPSLIGPVPVTKSSRGERILSAFRSSSRPAVPRPAGMENAVLGKMDKQDIKSQMDTFQSAYSKVNEAPRCHHHRTRYRTR